jgi:hypothetical protein
MSNRILYVTFFLAVFGFSCARKTTTQPAPPSNALTATVDGTAWSANTFSPSTVTGSALGFVGIKTSDGSQVEVTVPNTVTPGTYQINPFQYFNVTYTNGSGSDTYFGRTGTIVISSYSNNVMKGTFACTATNSSNTNSVSITNGSFTANF